MSRGVPVDGRSVPVDGRSVDESSNRIIVDDFDDGNMDEYNNSGVVVNTNNPYDGTYSAEVQGNNTNAYATPQSSKPDLNAYPSKGDIFEWYVYDGGDTRPRPVWGVPENPGTGGNGNREGIGPNFNYDTFDLTPVYSDGTDPTAVSKSWTRPDNEWMRMVVEWHDGSGSEPDNTHVVRVYNNNETELVEVNWTNSDGTFANNSGIAWRHANHCCSYHDSIAIIGQV